MQKPEDQVLPPTHVYIQTGGSQTHRAGPEVEPTVAAQFKASLCAQDVLYPNPV